MIEHESNRGYGGALISGFGAATKEWIFYTDGDAQYDASEVTKLIDAARADTDIVQGWKLSRGDTWYRKVIGRLYHYTVKFLFRLNVADTDCDFRLFRRSLIVERPLQSTSGVICVEMMRQFERAGANFVEVPVHHYERPSGRSQFFRLRAIARSAQQLLALWWRLMVLPSGLTGRDLATRSRQLQVGGGSVPWARARSCASIRAVAPHTVSSSSSKKWIGRSVGGTPQRSSR